VEKFILEIFLLDAFLHSQGQTLPSAYLQRSLLSEVKLKQRLQELRSGSKVGLPLESSLAPWRFEQPGVAKPDEHR
jgi:hypothetical protein